MNNQATSRSFWISQQTDFFGHPLPIASPLLGLSLWSGICPVTFLCFFMRSRSQRGYVPVLESMKGY